MSAFQALFQVVNSALNTPTNFNDTNAALNGTGYDATNSSLPATAFTLNSITSIIPLLFGVPALGDWLKLFLLGGLLESFRRFASTIWQYFIDSFWLTVHFEGNDSAYDWMMIWLSSQPTWRRARSLQVSTSSFGLNSRAVAIPGEQLDAKNNQDGETRSIGFLPAFGMFC